MSDKPTSWLQVGIPGFIGERPAQPASDLAMTQLGSDRAVVPIRTHAVVKRSVEFWVRGHAVTRGSTRPRLIRNGAGQQVYDEGGRPKIATMDSNRKHLYPWMERLAAGAIRACHEGDWGRAIVSAAGCEMVFTKARPKAHFHERKSGFALRADAPAAPAETLWDLDKLERAVLDALTGIIWDDDGRVVRVVGEKHYAPGSTPQESELYAGAWVRCWEL